jgi:chromosome segregation ATPase
MAKDLLQKLNVLLQASLRDAVSGGLGRLSRKRLGGDLKGEIAHLRQQLEAAYQDEEAMQRQITTLEGELVAWDEKADQAVLSQRDAEARYAIQQMETLKRRIAMLQSDLDSHRYAAHELLQHVNQLEGLLQAVEQEAQADPPELTVDDSLTLSQAIQRARETAEHEAAPEVVQVDVEPATAESQDDDKIEIDLATRRSRLAKPDA